VLGPESHKWPYWSLEIPNDGFSTIADLIDHNIKALDVSVPPGSDPSRLTQVQAIRMLLELKAIIASEQSSPVSH
jgi:hypothetical protein